MKKKCDLYTSEDISRYIDGDLSSDRYRSLELHLSLCRDCRNLADRYQSLSINFSRYTDKKTRGIEAENIAHKLEEKIFNSEKKFSVNLSGLFGKNIYLKLAGVLAVVIIGLLPFDNEMIKGPSDPSAIVNSVDTEYASVMIIETQKEKHTIIWFSEEI